MRFKDFLNEQPRHVTQQWQTKTPSKEEIIKWISLCADMLENGRPLFRGDNSIKEPTIIYPSTGTRNSTTVPLYQWMMDCSFKLKNYPSRSKSVIMSNDRDISAEYGTAHFCFPKWDAELVQMIDGSDFIKQDAGKPIFNHFGIGITIERFSLNLANRLKDEGFSTTNLADLKRQINSECETEDGLLLVLDCFGIYPSYKLNVNKNNVTAEEIAKHILIGQGAFDVLSSYFMTPYSLGIELTNNYHFTTKPSELWTESECLIVPFADMLKLKPELEQHINIDKYILQQ